MPSDNSEETELKLEVGSILLMSNDIRRKSFNEFGGGRAEVTFGVDVNEKNPLNTVSKVTLTLSDKESNDELFSGTSEFLVHLENQSDEEVHSTRQIVRQIAALALRVSFPFHRAELANSVTKVGLPAYFLPLVSDHEWLNIVDSAEMEMDEDQTPDE